MAKKIKKIFVGMARWILMVGLWPFEKMVLNKADKATSPLVFIIGPPRSGTTLIYEFLIRRYNFSYISNLAHRFYITPVVITLLGKNLIKTWRHKPKKNFSSIYGRIDGWGAPNEGGWIWNRWFPESYYLDESYLERIPVPVIQKTIYGLCKVMKGAFINKNVMHSVHMRLLDKIFPNCLFIHIHREIKSNMRSIIRAHTQVATDEYEWFSVKPKEWDLFKNENIIMRSAAQIYFIHKNIEADAEIIGRGRVLSISYEKFCQDPGAFLAQMGEFLVQKKVQIDKRDISIPDLSASRQVKFSDDVEQQIEECIAKL